MSRERFRGGQGEGLIRAQKGGLRSSLGGALDIGDGSMKRATAGGGSRYQPGPEEARRNRRQRTMRLTPAFDAGNKRNV